MDGFLVRASGARPRRAAPLLLVVACALFAGCAREQPRAVTFNWVLGGSEPAFDPQGPPDPRRWALERLFTYGLVAEDSSGSISPAAADSLSASDDSLTWTFRLKPGLAFTDGTPCHAADFVRALAGGLTRTDHSTRAWELAAVRGVDQVRAGKPLPASLGIEAPDERTVVLRLARRDPLLLRKLAVPGVAAPWSARSDTTWDHAAGLGPWRVLDHLSERRLRAVPARAARRMGAWRDPDTLVVRFGLPPGRVRALMREGASDLVWPLPVGMLDEPLPSGYRSASAEARPARRMLLVMRADLPPTSSLPARRALAHGINRDDIVQLLGPYARRAGAALTGASRGEFPALDGNEIRQWMDRGKLGRSFHANLAFRGDGPGAAIARAMQGDWARFAIYVEPQPLRGRKWPREALGGLSHLLLTESQAVLDDPSAELAQIAMPPRGPAVGPWRSGWHTREFDNWTGYRPAPGPMPVDAIEARLEDETVVLPLAEMPWAWIERAGVPPLPLHPHFGPLALVPATTSAAPR